MMRPSVAFSEMLTQGNLPIIVVKAYIYKESKFYNLSYSICSKCDGRGCAVGGNIQHLKARVGKKNIATALANVLLFLHTRGVNFKVVIGILC